MSLNLTPQEKAEILKKHKEETKKLNEKKEEVKKGLQAPQKPAKK